MVWVGVVVVCGFEGVDLVLVVFDVVDKGIVVGVDVVFIDIVGWLYIKVGLMDELDKVKCVVIW